MSVSNLDRELVRWARSRAVASRSVDVNGEHYSSVRGLSGRDVLRLCELAEMALLREGVGS